MTLAQPRWDSGPSSASYVGLMGVLPKRPERCALAVSVSVMNSGRFYERTVAGLTSLGLVILFFSFASAEERRRGVHLFYDRDAVIKVCPLPRPLGCVTKIVIDGKEYLLDPLGAENDHIQAIVESYQFEGLRETEPGSVVGFFVIEKGHFPNPTAKFKVFKLLSADFPPPPEI